MNDSLLLLGAFEIFTPLPDLRKGVDEGANEGANEGTDDEKIVGLFVRVGALDGVLLSNIEGAAELPSKLGMLVGNSDAVADGEEEYVCEGPVVLS